MKEEHNERKTTTSWAGKGSCNVIKLGTGKQTHKVKVKYLFVSLDQISVVCGCPEQKPTRAKKLSKITAGVPGNTGHTADAKRPWLKI